MSRGARRIALGLGLTLACAIPARAITLGTPQVLSAAGPRVEARIPLRAQRGEALGAACFALVQDGAANASSLAQGTLELRRHARGADLFVRGVSRPGADASTFAIAIRCPASSPATLARFSLPASVAAAELPIVTRITTREGDTLAGLARAIFPNDGFVRGRYLQALRARNPPLASLADDAPLAPASSLALVDLHAFAQTIPARAAGSLREAEASRLPGQAPKAAPPKATRAELPPAASPLPVPRRDSATRTPVASPMARDRSASGGFQLRLSAPMLDLSPSKSMDAHRRAALRERLLILQSDDRTSQVLAMREDIRRLESQVKALQLKLAEVPVAPATPAPRALPIAKASSPVAPQAAPQVLPDAAKAKRAAANRHVIPWAEGEEPWYRGPWWMGALAALLAIAFALRLRGRREARVDADDSPIDEEAPVGAQGSTPDASAPEAPDASLAAEHPAIGVAAIAIPAALRIPAEDHAELRRRYMEERFPEIGNGTLVLEDPRSVLHAAGLLYEDGAAPRAIELLHFAIEQDGHALAPWLALFDIFRRERLSGEHAQLAERFHARHGAGDEWRKVCSVGRSIDPDRALYEGTELGLADPQAQGWLHASSSGLRSALAGELRTRLMAQARISEEDLRADPTPALRKAESFSVA